MPYVVATLSVLLTVVCAVHAIKTGRGYWWLWIIILFQGIGPAIYFLVEILPELQRTGTVRRVGSDLVTIVDPGRSLRRLEEELEIADTVKNRQMLARGYLKAGRYDEAVELYRRCLTGAFKDDTGLGLELAYALFLAGAYEEAKTKLDEIGEVNLGIRRRERDLLYARTLEQLDDLEGALKQYEGVVKQASGEEARCRYAMLLDRTGRTEEANQVFHEIIARARRSPRFYRRAQKQWIEIARRSLGK